MARRERADAVVLGQNLLGQEPGAREFLATAPCPVAVAPYGHRFVRAFAPARITVACGPPGPADGAVRLATVLAERFGAHVRLIVAGDGLAEEWLAHAQGLAPAAAATRVAGRGAAALMAQTRGDVDVLVIAGADDELLRQAGCPVLVVPPPDRGRAARRRIGVALGSPHVAGRRPGRAQACAAHRGRARAAVRARPRDRPGPPAGDGRGAHGRPLCRARDPRRRAPRARPLPHARHRRGDATASSATCHAAAASSACSSTSPARCVSTTSATIRAPTASRLVIRR